jgi:gliding motility-associated-like protein
MQNPTNVYTNSGNYTVTVKVTNDKGCFSVASKPAYIRITGGVQSAFSNTQPTVCKPPFSIAFTNTSTGSGTLNYLWDFGDGTTATTQNPTHVYTAPGSYSVTLTTTSSIGCSDTLRRNNLLNFQNINTGINVPDSICVNTPFNVLNNSTPAPTAASWNFGDATSSTDINPVKVYTVPGTYTIQLTNTYSYCSDTASRSIRVLPRPVANFTADSLFKCRPNMSVRFQDLSTNAVAWSWDFGDGTTSNLQNPTHIYTGFGYFNVRLIVTNRSGCTDTLQRDSLIRIVRPTISFPGLPQRGCIPYGVNFTASINTLDAVTSYLWNFGDGNTSTVASPSHVYTAQGSYTVSLTITTSTGCTETATVGGAITVGRKPVINFTAVPNPVCAFQQVQFTDLTNEANEWVWQFGDGSSSTQQNPIHAYNDTGRFNVTLIATNFGCPDTLRRDTFIRVKPPIARFYFQTNCDNRRQFAFRDSSIGATSWLWDFGDGTTSTQQHPVHVFPAFGTYNIRLTVMNDTCSHSTTQSIQVVNVNPNFTANATALCRVGNVSFTSSVINTSQVVNYTWSFGDGRVESGSGLPNISNAYQRSGTYTVTLVTTDIYGCRDTITRLNYIRISGPTVGFTGSNRVGCKGLTATFIDTSRSDGISPITTWRWDFGDGNTQTFTNNNPVQHTYPVAGVYNVKLVVRDAGGCSDSITQISYVITTDPKAEFVSADTLACPGSLVQFTNQSTGNGLTSFWQLGDGTTSNAVSPTHAYTATGLYTIKLVVTDAYTCSDSITKVNYIRVDRPRASYTLSDSISSCAPFEVTFTNTSTYFSSIMWNLGGGMSTAANPTQYYFTPGNYQTYLAITSPGGCVDTAFKTISVYDTIGTRITYQPLSGCKPLTVDLRAFTNGPVSYTWDFGDGVILNTPTDSLRHIYNFFGDFVPKLILTDPSGCVIPVTGPDTIRIIGVTAKFGLDKKLLCDSGRIQFLDSTTFNDSTVLYTWNFGDGTTSNIRQPAHQYTTPGFYTISLAVQTQNNCNDTFTLNNVLKVSQSPLITIGGDSVVCINGFMDHLGVFLRSDTTNSSTGWSWRFPNNNTSTQQNPVKQQYTVAGTFTAQTIATNTDGCADTATKQLIIHPLPVITMPAQLVKTAGIPITIPATYSSNTATYNWMPIENLNCTNCPQPETNTKFNKKYTVSVVDSNSCQNRRQIDIIVTCPNVNVFMPNTFSPNGDGANDMLMVRGRGLERVKLLRIFNRWGQVVFEKANFPVNDAMYGWDGKFQGKPALPDVYVYQLEVFCENSQVIRFDGNVALIQ